MNAWNHRRLSTGVMLLALAACRQPAARQPGAEAGPAELVLMNATVYTMDSEHPRAEAVAVAAGRIVHVGSRDSMRSFVGPRTKVQDLQGLTMLPALHDAHNHLIWSATELEDVNLFEARTMDELLAPIAARAASSPSEPWIRGSGWEASAFEGKIHRSQLDGIAPEKPVYMASADGHSAWVNSAALALAGITAKTPDPEGGRIERDKQGEPTGILRESATGLVSRLMPPYATEQVDRGLAKGLAQANAYGITSIIDPNVEAWMLDGYQRFADRHALTVRVHAAVKVTPARGTDQLHDIEALRSRYSSPMVQVNAIKLYVDGVIESRTAYMIEPYQDGSKGKPNFPDETLAQIAVAFDRAGFQLHAHVIGDGAVRQMLGVIERVQRANGPRDRRPLLAHVQVVNEADIPRFAALGAYALFSPLWAYADPSITDLTVPAIGPARSEWLYPMGALQRAGAVLVAGSDWSVSSMDPFDAMETAITRQDAASNTGAALTPQHRVTVQQILEAYTIHGARAAFVEKELGSITVGKRADLIVIDRDPFAIEAHDISEIRVLRTLLDGREVYRAGPAQARSGRAPARVDAAAGAR